MLEHEFLFGTRLAECVQHIQCRAVREGSQEAFARAEAKIDGLREFLGCWMQLSPDTTLPLQNAQRKMLEMANDPDLRQRVLQAMESSDDEPDATCRLIHAP